MMQGRRVEVRWMRGEYDARKEVGMDRLIWGANRCSWRVLRNYRVLF